MAGSNKKVYTIFAGINGAGKSTLYHSLNKEIYGVRLNSDEVLAQSGGDWKNSNDQFHAGKSVIALQVECFNKGLSMNRETTVGGLSINRSIKMARDRGYEVNLFFVGIDSLELAKSRVFKRVAFGGHGVKEDVMDIRYNMLNKTIAELVCKCDNVKFYDNSKENIELVAFGNSKNIYKTKDDCKWLDELLKAIELENERLASSQSNEPTM
ncbi:MAG: AAA family ATPase [Clostridia bacterium]|nr:AAA family ATPase [Clostridia bacterium]